MTDLWGSVREGTRQLINISVGSMVRCYAGRRQVSRCCGEGLYCKTFTLALGYDFKELAVLAPFHYSGLLGFSLKPQPHEDELTCWIVDELRIRLILGEQATFSCLFVTGERSHRNRRRLQRRSMTTENIFSAGYLNCSCLQNKRVLLDTFIVHLSREQTLVSQGAAVRPHELACRKLWRCVRLDYRSRVAEA